MSVGQTQICSFVLLSKPKTKSLQWKKEWDNQRNSFIKIARVQGRCETTRASKTKKCVLWLIVTKNQRLAISKQPKSASQNTPFCPFSKGAQNRTNHITLIICALQTIFCVFVFLRFCVLNFNCEMRRHRKGHSSGERFNKNSIRYSAHILKKKRMHQHFWHILNMIGSMREL